MLHEQSVINTTSKFRRDQKSPFGQHTSDSYVIIIIVYNVVLGIIVISENICTTNAEMGDSCHPLNHQMI